MNKLRKLFWPISLFYGALLYTRNVFYNKDLLDSYTPTIKTIAIGNLSLGGTGKTPHVEYVLRFFKGKKVAVLSRGYGRKSKGTLRITTDMSAMEAGDEPLQIAGKFPEVVVVVDGDRRRGLEYIGKEYPETELVILDDALQHRKIKAGLNILLTTWQNPFTTDDYLPAGNLRDHRIRAKNADIIIVTKCPPEPDPVKREKILSAMKKYKAPILFDSIRYGNLKPLSGNIETNPQDYERFLVVTGIALPAPFVNYITEQYIIAEHFEYRDHHPFSASDFDRFRKFIGRFAPGSTAIITTEKDAMRLKEISAELAQPQLPIFYLDITIDLGEDAQILNKNLLAYVEAT